MLSSWIVASHKVIGEIALWVFLAAGSLIGVTIVGLLDHVFLGFLVGSVATFFGMSVFLGASLLLGEIHSNVVDIRKRLESIESRQGAPVPNSAPVTEHAEIRADTTRQYVQELASEEVPTEAEEPMDDQQLMALYGITFDGEKYIYMKYHYEKLEDAVNYARLQRGLPSL